jgi:hypothetical protein
MPSKFGFTNSDFDLNAQRKNEWETRLISTLQEIVDEFAEYKGLRNIHMKPGSVHTNGAPLNDIQMLYTVEGVDARDEPNSFEIYRRKGAQLDVVFAKCRWKTSHIIDDARELAAALAQHTEALQVTAYVNEMAKSPTELPKILSAAWHEAYQAEFVQAAPEERAPYVRHLVALYDL